MKTSKAKEKLILFVVLTGGCSNVWTVVWMQKGLIVERLQFLLALVVNHPLKMAS